MSKQDKQIEKATSKSKFGVLAIARAERNSDDQLVLTVIDRGPFATKGDVMEAIDKKLHNGEAGNKLGMVRLNGLFESQKREVMQPVEIVKTFEIDEVTGEPLEGEDAFEEVEPEAAAAE